MNNRLNEQIRPICRFGPGGDFISVWPQEPTALPKLPTNRLTKLLASISEIITVLIGPEVDDALAESMDIHHPTGLILRQKEKLEYEIETGETDKSAYTTPITDIKNDSRISGEPMLFSDDSRISIRIGHKPKHRIRAYRRAAKKRPAPSLSGQSSLFEVDFKSARTA